MKSQFLLLCFCSLSITANNLPIAKSLDNVIKDLSSIARLTNGIAIQTGISENPNTINDIMAEFLGVESGELIVKLKSLGIEELSKNLTAFNKKFESFPGLKVKDVSALGDSLSKLEGLKKNVEALRKNVPDSSADLKNRTEIGRGAAQVSLYDVSNIGLAIEKLNYIRVTPFKTIDTGNFKPDFVAPLKNAFETMINQFGIFKTYKTMDAPAHLHDIDKELEGFNELVSASRTFFESVDSFKSMSSELDALNGDVANFKSTLDSKDDLVKLSNSSSIASHLVRLLKTSRASANRLSLGFSGGVSDLKALQDDLKEKKLTTLIAEGKDLKELKIAISMVLSLSKPFEELDSSWKTFMNSTDSLKTVNQVLSDTSQSVVPLEQVSKMQTDLKTVSDCVKKLKSLTAYPSLSDVDELLEFASEVSTQIRKFLATMKDIIAISDYSTQASRVQKLRDDFDAVLQDLNSSTVAMCEEIWNRWKNDTKIEQLLVILNTIHTKMIGFKTESPFISVKKKVNFDVIPAVLKSVSDTNLVATLDCLQNVAYTPGDIYKLVSLGSSVQNVKNEKKSFESAEKTLLDLVEVEGKVLEVEKAVPKKNPRRRRAPKSLANFQNSQKVSEDLGKGVQVLREFAKILENEELVRVVVNADDGLKNAISAIPGVQSVWTDENRKGMGKMVVDLKELDKFAGSVKMDNMTSLWQIFDEADKIPGVQIDAKTFVDPISKGLAASSDPKIQGAAGDFKTLGGLKLQFAEHKLYLKSAFLTLTPLKDFFVGFFGNQKASGASQAPTVSAQGSSSFDYNIIIFAGVGIALVAGLGAGGYFGRKKYMEKKEKKQRWENRERHWIYVTLFDGNDVETNIALAAKEGKLEDVRRLIKEGKFLNVYYHGMTPLHYAIENLHPEIVDLLISNGADRTMLSVQYRPSPEGSIQPPERYLRSPEQILKKKMEEKKTEEGDEIVAIFEKHRDKVYQPVIPPLLPLEKFCIKLDATCPSAAKFRKTYAQNVHTEHSNKITHYCVDTDKDGVFDIDAIKAPEKDEEKIFCLAAIFSDSVLVKSSWLEECLKSKKNFYKDYEHRVTKVRWGKKVYETIDEWKKWMRRREIPCFEGVRFSYQQCREEEKLLMKPIVEALGAEWIGHNTELFYYDGYKVPPFYHPDLLSRFHVYAKEQLNSLIFEMKMFDPNLENDETRDATYTVWSLVKCVDYLLTFNGFADPKIAKKVAKELEPVVKTSAEKSSQASTSSAVTK